jgi:hypothetical protein
MKLVGAVESFPLMSHGWAPRPRRATADRFPTLLGLPSELRRYVLSRFLTGDHNAHPHHEPREWGIRSEPSRPLAACKAGRGGSPEDPRSWQARSCECGSRRPDAGSEALGVGVKAARLSRGSLPTLSQKVPMPRHYRPSSRCFHSRRRECLSPTAIGLPSAPVVMRGSAESHSELAGPKT